MSTHTRVRVALTTALITMVALVLGSCLERREKIVVHKDGSLDVTWALAGDEADARSGLGLPTGTPWKIKTWKEKNKKDEERFHYQARARFDNVKGLDAALDFSQSDLETQSSVEIKKDRGRTFYIFKRTYRGRDWWRFKRIKDQELSPEFVERISKKPFRDLATADQRKLVSGLTRFETKKRLLIVADGLGRAMLKSGFPSQAIEKCQDELEHAYTEVLTAERILRLFSLEGAAQKKETAAINRELERTEQQILERNMGPYRSVNWREEVAKVMTDFELTEDLTDENFKLEVELPGTLIVTNGEQTGANSVSWEFKGESLMNQDVPVYAISVVD